MGLQFFFVSPSFFCTFATANRQKLVCRKKAHLRYSTDSEPRQFTIQLCGNNGDDCLLVVYTYAYTIYSKWSVSSSLSA